MQYSELIHTVCCENQTAQISYISVCAVSFCPIFCYISLKKLKELCCKFDLISSAV